jgi:hypothetical protein
MNIDRVISVVKNEMKLETNAQSLLGIGGFGMVFRAVDKSGTKHAVKVCLKENTMCGVYLHRELELHKSLVHPNVVRLFEGKELDFCTILDLEYCDTDLYNYSQKKKILEPEFRILARQLTCGLKALHERKIAHRDIKSKNVLLKFNSDGSYVAKLADFGLAKDIGSLKTYAGTIVYMAPEVLTAGAAPYTEKCDVWSMGIMYYNLLTNSYPYRDLSELGIMKQVCGAFETFSLPSSLKVSDKCKDFVRSHLFKKPELRNYNHPYVFPRIEIEALRKEVERQRQVIAGLEKKMGQLTLGVTAFYETKEIPCDFPAPFVTKAVEVLGLTDGTEYVIQGKGGDGQWKKIFAQTYHSVEVGLQQFRNEVAYKSYRLVCMSAMPLGRPEFKLYKPSDDTKLFRKGIPPFTAASPVQHGYEITVSSQWGVSSNPSLFEHMSYNLLDDNVNTKWAGVGKSTHWVFVKLPRPRVFNAVEIGTRGDGWTDQSPKEFRIEGSLDQKSWKRLLPSEKVAASTVTTGPWALGERRVFAFPNEQEFLFYRLMIIKNHGGWDTSFGVFNLGNIAKL